MSTASTTCAPSSAAPPRAGPDRDELSIVREKAATRARQGIPVDALIATYLAGQRVLWSAIRASTPQTDAGRAAGEELAAVTFSYTKAITESLSDAYAAEAARLARERSPADPRALIADLLAGRVDRDDARLASTSLASAGPRRVVVAIVEPPAVRERAARALAGLGAAAVWSGEEVVAVLAGGPAGQGAGRPSAAAGLGPGAAASLVARAAAGLRERGETVSVRAGLSLPSASGPLAPALAEARRALAHAQPPDGVVALDGVSLFDEVARSADELTQRLVRDDVREALADPVSSATLDAYAEAGLNVQRAAAALDVHPNTVHYRLDRLRERTALDPRRFHDLVDLLLARRLLDDGG